MSVIEITKCPPFYVMVKGQTRFFIPFFDINSCTNKLLNVKCKCMLRGDITNINILLNQDKYGLTEFF